MVGNLTSTQKSSGRLGLGKHKIQQALNTPSFIAAGHRKGSLRTRDRFAQIPCFVRGSEMFSGELSELVCCPDDPFNKFVGHLLRESTYRPDTRAMARDYQTRA